MAPLSDREVVGPYLDLSPGELLAGCSALGYESPRWLFPAFEHESRLEGEIRAGRGGLVAKGLVRVGAHGAEMDPYLADILETLSGMAVVTAVVSAAESVDVSWLFSNPISTTLLHLTGGVVRVRRASTDALPALIERMAGLDRSSAPLAESFQMTGPELTAFMESLVARLGVEEPQDALVRWASAPGDLPEDEFRVAALISFAAAPGASQPPSWITWVTNGGRTGRVNVDAGSWTISPTPGESLVMDIKTMIKRSIEQMEALSPPESQA